jgi:peptidoglycan hydrolase-like protein with peptidoglycan-binding domain
MIGRAQTALKELGYYEGQADGRTSERTSNALKAFQREHKLAETGNLDEGTARALGILGSGVGTDRRAGTVPKRDPGSVGRTTPPRDASDNERTPVRTGASDAVLANVLSAIGIEC